MTSATARPDDRQTLLVRYGNFLFRYRNGVFPAVMVALFLLCPPQPLMGDWAADRWLDLAGLLVCLSGQGLRAVVIGLAYIKRGGVNKQIFAARLVQEGMFATSRNPLYVGNILVLVGLFLIHNNPLAYVLGGAFFLISYHAIVAAEERYLRGQFGQEYDDYCRRVNRWLPSPSKIGPAVAGMRFNWQRLVIKEYGSFFSWIVTALLILGYQAWWRDGWPGASQALAWIGGGLVASAVLAGVVRALKKSGALRDSTA